MIVIFAPDYLVVVEGKFIVVQNPCTPEEFFVLIVQDKVGMIENNTMRTVATANIRSFKAIDEYEFELELTSDLPEEIGVGL